MRIINRLLIIPLFMLGSTVCADNSNERNKPAIASVIYLKVVAVEDNDTLNMREAATGESKAVYKLPYNASGILKLEDFNGWVKLSYKQYTGWAYGKYLKATSSPGLSPEIPGELSCFGTEPHWLLKTNKNNLKYKKYDDEANYIFNSSLENLSEKDDSWSFSAINSTLKGSAITVTINRDAHCSDDMSDNTYSHAITVHDKEIGELKACCNKTKN